MKVELCEGKIELEFESFEVLRFQLMKIELENFELKFKEISEFILSGFSRKNQKLRDLCEYLNCQLEKHSKIILIIISATFSDSVSQFSTVLLNFLMILLSFHSFAQFTNALLSYDSFAQFSDDLTVLLSFDSFAKL
jgi:hypothetical protein